MSSDRRRICKWAAGALALLAATAPPALAGSGPGLAPAWSPAGKTFLNRDEALALAFPDCEVERTTVYLSEADCARIQKAAKVDFDSRVVYPYRATREGKWVGTAYFDTHRVRTLRETLMVVVKADGSLDRVEVLSFGEPLDYVPRAKWYAQFPGATLDDELHLKRRIRNVTGATLTAQATVGCTRRVLALHAELRRQELEREKERKRRERERREREKAKTQAGAGEAPPPPSRSRPR